ncbi:hypothetical protein GQX73_g5562 [Xylaria multiplex]|uniref:PRISE-like Rossmann-fold domain-containing protein n=1 Tax=Xylaria multiplex TaxID=323545 RepID=A0A7C8IN89_9PEZI|nr:hypothetical protein GQX73_g5562 [Xylaria multiplex]
MSSRDRPLRTCGIYRNLPEFGPSVSGLTAIICGATGVSGFHALRALLSSPRWSRIFILSRSPLSSTARSFLSNEQLFRTTYVSVDLLSSAETISQKLSEAKVKADYVFYYAYLQPVTNGMSADVAQDLINVNVPMFRNLLDALPLANTTPKRILLQTGGKNYGVHAGRGRTPLVESDPQPRLIADNFYYHQEDLLKAFCEKHPGTSWNVIRPMGIIGAVANSPLNGYTCFGVYAAVQAHKGEPLEFGGNLDAWQTEQMHSSARLTGYLSEWAVLEPECANQAFNALDGTTLSWDRLFEAFASWWGVSKGVVGPDLDESKYRTDLSLGGGDANPLGYGPPVNEDAWVEMMAKSDGKLTWNPFKDKDANFMGDFGYIVCGTPSASKTRRFGYNGFVDTLESLHEMYLECERFGMLPKMSQAKAQPLI